MKISKGNFITGSIGIVAAAALLVGNGTFASWSDSYTDTGNNVGASVLQLNVGQSGVQHLDKINMYPGGSADFEFLIASRDGEAVPLADLALEIENLIDNEDGCSNTSSEAAVDDCSAQPGDFSGEAGVVVNVSLPTLDTANACTLPRGSMVPGSVDTLKELKDFGSLDLLRDGPDADTLPDSLAPGQGICVGLAIYLPAGATNAVQGDDSTFDVEFNLTQHI